ncbi:MAG: hypothetical protein A2Z02_04760 [Chloroflexi bacterium RBG_16_48_7]|nr:MAG: hypothetical protein A2Z02_04760 [Chloroflexi bacterium RBG_16_48_7]
MNRSILVVPILMLALLPGCSIEAPVTLPHAQGSPLTTETAVSTSANSIHSLPPLDAFMKGFAFADWNPFDRPRPPAMGPLYNPAQSDHALKNLAATGSNWISLVVQVRQETIASTNITRNQYNTASDEALRHIIELAHSQGMRVMLSPYIGLASDPRHLLIRDGVTFKTEPQWQPINIGMAYTDEAQWQEWFASYKDIINYYATFAQEAGVDMLSVGHELGITSSHENDWRRVIQEVRQRFKGPITYSSLDSSGTDPAHGEEKRIKWWDAVDYIGVDVYYKLADKNTPALEELKAAWTKRGYVELLENLSSRFNKPIIFTEFGYRSIDGAARCPGCWTIDAPPDFQEQADCYQAAFESLWGKPWLKGIFWWQWFANPLKGQNEKDYTPLGKPAEEILKKFYLSK